MPGIQGGPFMNVIAAKAVAFHEAEQPEFRDYQKQIIINAQELAQHLQNLDYQIVAGGTDNHLFILDLRNKEISGRKAEVALQKAGITVSRSCIPFDTAKPWITSGVRLGTPAVTTRGMKEKEMALIAQFIDRALQYHDNNDELQAIRQKVEALCKNFPIYK